MKRMSGSTIHQRCPRQRDNQGPQYTIVIKVKKTVRAHNTSYASKTKRQSGPTTHHRCPRERDIQDPQYIIGVQEKETSWAHNAL